MDQAQRKIRTRNVQHRRSQWFAWSLVSAVLCVPGCSQSFWRKQADQDTYQALHQAETDPRWVTPRKNLTPDPRSRFFDPYDPDHEPLPPDDPAAAKSMDCPGGIPGYKSWHELGRSFSVENPAWLQQFEFTPEMVDEKTGEYVCPLPMIRDLTILKAVELTYLHSRDYQFQLEETYLAALALTLERFRFQVRFLGIGGNEPGGSLTYENVPGFQDSLGMTSSFGVSQLLPTGGQWAVELANNTLWIFSGPNAGTNSASLLSYRLVQPLLLGAGRKIALESLTQAERNLLYAVRNLARFRQILFVNTVGGTGSGGYLGLLTQLQGIRNQEYNIKQLERQVRELKARAAISPGITTSPLKQYPEGLVIPESLSLKLQYDPEWQLLSWAGAMSEEQARELVALSNDISWQASVRELTQLLRSEIIPLDVVQLESRLASAIISLRNSQRNFQDSLDAYKVQLGLPPDIEVTVDDAGLDQFVLIDPLLDDLQREIETSVEVTGLLDVEFPDLELAQQAEQVVRSLYDKIVQQAVRLLEGDVQRVEENLDRRLASVVDEQERQEIIRTIEKDKTQLQALKVELEDLGAEFEMIDQYLKQAVNDPESLTAAIPAIQEMRQELLLRVQSLQVVQVGLRSELISVNRFTLSMEDAVGLAVENRLDLMNVRADVVDARRQEEIAANRLKAVLDVIVEGDIRNEPGSNKPFDFSGTSSSHRVGVQFTAPLDQVAERNAYRASQINFQRARRNYMEVEDRVKLDVRTSWRNLQLIEQNLETARQALRINVIQYDQAVEESNDPNRSTQGGVRGRNLVNALNDILDAQDRLVQLWASYERSRLNIQRDMGMMDIDPQGLWVDPYYQKMYSLMPETDFQTPLETPEPTAGDYDVTLLPPGPAGTTHDKDNIQLLPLFPSEERASNKFNESVPAPPAQQVGEKTSFVADPLGWQPGDPPRHLLRDRDAVEREARSLPGTVRLESLESTSGSADSVVPAPGQNLPELVPGK